MNECTKLYFIFLKWERHIFWWCMNGCTKLYFFSFDFKRMHKTLFFTFSFCYENALTMHKNLFSLFYISFKMYFQNSFYVIECSMDAFEDVWCMCKCMMYVMICDACLDVWWMSKCMLYIYKYDACKMYACQ